MHRHWHLRIGTIVLALTLAPDAALAQVPRFEQTPYSLLSGLRSLSPTTRRTAAGGLSRFRKSREAYIALVNALLSDPDVSVRQAAATTLAKHGAKGRAQLARAAVCDPDPSTREGLADYGRRANIRCDKFGVEMGDAGPLPQAEAQLLRYAAHPVPATRRNAVKALARSRSAKGLRKVWNMASLDPVWKIRTFALSTVARSYRAKALSKVRYALTQDPDARVRAQAIRELATMRVRAAVKLIGASARVEQIPEMRVVAIRSLAKLKSKAAVRELISISEGHQNENTRAYAVRTLARLSKGNPKIKKVMARVLRNDRSGKVRAAALKALSTDMSDGACMARAANINDPHPAVRRALVSQLAKCKPKIARPALVKTTARDQDPEVRREAVKILVKLGAVKVKATLFSVLRGDSDEGVRRTALAAVLRLPRNMQHKVLAEVARSDSAAGLRASAVRGLSRLTSNMAVPALASVLARDREPQVRLAAARALSRYRDAQAYKALSKAASSDAAPEVRKAAARGAAKSPAQKAWVNSLLPQTIDPSAATRLNAIRKLLPLQVPRTYRALVSAMWKDQSSAVRTAVAKGFSDIDHPLCDVGLKVAHDTDSDGAVVRAVERATRKRFERLRRTIELASSNPDAAKRRAAVNSLRPSPFKQVRELLEKLLTKDDDPGVRLAAARVLVRYRDRRALQKLMQASQAELHAKTRQQKVKLYNGLRNEWAAARRALNLSTLMNRVRAPKLRQRVRAVRAMGVLRDRRAFATLQQAAKSNDPQVRFAAVVSLAVFGDVTVVPKSARTEKDPAAKQLLMQLNLLRSAPVDKVVATLQSEKKSELLVAMSAAAMKPSKQVVPWLVRIALVYPDKELRLVAAQTLALMDHPLSRWAILVASNHDASKKLRRRLWQWAVYADTQK